MKNTTPDLKMWSKQAFSLFMVISLLFVILGCVRVPQTYEATYKLSFHDQETGERLTNGYVVSSLSTVIERDGCFVCPHPPGDKTKGGPKRLHKINKDGTVTVTKDKGWENLGVSVFVSGHKHVSFNVAAQPRNNRGWRAEWDGKHLKVYLPDVRGDYEGIRELYSHGNFGSKIGDPIFVDGNKVKITPKMKKELDNFQKQIEEQYEKARKKHYAQYSTNNFQNSYIETKLNGYKQFKFEDKRNRQEQLIRIAILDSGIDKEVILNSGERILDPLNVSGTKHTSDKFGHGNFVTSIINGNLPIRHREQRYQILPIKILNDRGFAGPEEIARGIATAIQENADVINISVGSFYDSNKLRETVSKAEKKNISIIAAAGNHQVDKPFYPASYSGVIGVSAVDESNQRLIGNYGDWVDIYTKGKFTGLDENGTSQRRKSTSGAAAYVTSQIVQGEKIKNFQLEEKVLNESRISVSKRFRVQYGVETHKKITNDAIRQSIQSIESGQGFELYPELRPIEDVQDNFDTLIQATEAQDDVGRFFNHFRHQPTGNRMTANEDVINSWFTDNVIESLTEFPISMPDTDAKTWGINADVGVSPDDDPIHQFRWIDAVARYDYTDQAKESAYHTLGHVVHLIQDMHVPDHVHDDPHPAKVLLSVGDFSFVIPNWQIPKNMDLSLIDFDSDESEFEKYAGDLYFYEEQGDVQSDNDLTDGIHDMIDGPLNFSSIDQAFDTSARFGYEKNLYEAELPTSFSESAELDPVGFSEELPPHQVVQRTFKIVPGTNDAESITGWRWVIWRNPDSIIQDESGEFLYKFETEDGFGADTKLVEERRDYPVIPLDEDYPSKPFIPIGPGDDFWDVNLEAEQAKNTSAEVREGTVGQYYIEGTQQMGYIARCPVAEAKIHQDSLVVNGRKLKGNRGVKPPTCDPRQRPTSDGRC